jgi:hypothetical protein
LKGSCFVPAFAEFHLRPATHRIDDLPGDYKEMKAMIFGAYPEWDEIVEGQAAAPLRPVDIERFGKFAPLPT